MESYKYNSSILKTDMVLIDFKPENIFEPYKIGECTGFECFVVSASHILMGIRSILDNYDRKTIVIGNGGVRLINIFQYLNKKDYVYSHFRINREIPGSFYRYNVNSNSIPMGPLILLDDVICTGGTLNKISSFFKNNQDIVVLSLIRSGNSNSPHWQNGTLAKCKRIISPLIIKNINKDKDRENPYNWPAIFNLNELKVKMRNGEFIEKFKSLYNPILLDLCAML